MTPLRYVAFALSVVLAGCSGLVAVAAPANASVTTLCTGYAACARAGMSDAGYSKVSSKMYWRMYSGHNCTNYAAYRMVHGGLSNTRPWSGGGNATYWGTSMSRSTNATPAVGAVAWWKARVYPAGSAGHVAYVERVVSANEIIVSMDSWHGDFSWARITRTSKGWPSGFVHFHDVRLVSKAVPTMSGTVKVGSRLTARPGSWSVPGVTTAYRWKADGASIAGATGSTLTLARAQQGKRITVQVTASLLGYPKATAVSAASAAVQPGVLSNTSKPGVSGEPRVDGSLTATPGSWTPTPTQLRYQWRADAAPIPGATSARLDLAPSMAGKAISVTVTATRTGYAGVSATSPATRTVEPGTLTVTASPTVAGAPRLGRSLTVRRPGVLQSARTTVQWYRAGRAVPGATSSTYRVTGADLGSRLRATVRLTRPGYAPRLVRTPSTTPVRTTPRTRIATHTGTGRLSFRLVARAAGVGAVPGVVQVRTHGHLVRAVRLRHGVAAAILTGLHRGVRTYHFRVVPTSAKVTRAAVHRRLRIG